jgi:hypothetical protein
LEISALSLEDVLAKLQIPLDRFARWLLNERFCQRVCRTLLARAQFAYLKKNPLTQAIDLSFSTDIPTSPPSPGLPPPTDEDAHNLSDTDRSLLAQLIRQHAIDRGALSPASKEAPPKPS